MMAQEGKQEPKAGSQPGPKVTPYGHSDHGHVRCVTGCEVVICDVGFRPNAVDRHMEKHNVVAVD